MKRSFPGAYSWWPTLKVSGHAGWTEKPYGLLTLNQPVHLARSTNRAVPKLEKLGCRHLARAARACPLECVEEVDARFIIDWSSASHSGRVHDTYSGRKLEGALQIYETLPMPLPFARTLINAITRDADANDSEREAWAQRLAAGSDAEPLEELELEVGPTIDRLIRHASNGAFDEAAVDLASMLASGTRDELLSWEGRLDAKLRGPTPPDLPSWLGNCDAEPGTRRASPLGVVECVMKPALRLHEGTVLPPVLEWIGDEPIEDDEDEAP